MTGRKIILVIGGARSGKSSFALGLGETAGKCAEPESRRKIFVATAEVLDAEIRQRVQAHRRLRAKKGWKTVEEPLHISKVLSEYCGKCDVLLLDCITLWLSNLLHRFEADETKVQKEVERLLSVIKTVNYELIMVSNDVGQGIVPENKLARVFRDIAGITNQKLAAAADEVYILFAGIPLRLKKSY